MDRTPLNRPFLNLLKPGSTRRWPVDFTTCSPRCGNLKFYTVSPAKFSIMPAEVQRRWRLTRPSRPVLGAFLYDGSGATSPIRAAMQNRQLSADSGRSRGRGETARFYCCRSPPARPHPPATQERRYEDAREPGRSRLSSAHTGGQERSRCRPLYLHPRYDSSTLELSGASHVRPSVTNCR